MTASDDVPQAAAGAAAQAAYAAYVLSVTGDPAEIRPWDCMPPERRADWRAAVEAAAPHLAAAAWRDGYGQGRDDEAADLPLATAPEAHPRRAEGQIARAAAAAERAKVQHAMDRVTHLAEAAQAKAVEHAAAAERERILAIIEDRQRLWQSEGEPELAGALADITDIILLEDGHG